MSSGMYRRTGCGAPFPSFPSRRDAAATIILPGLRAPAPAGAFAPARRVVVRILCLCALVFGVSGAVAQSAQTVPQFTLGTSAVDSVPQTTVVPVQQPPVQVVEHTTVYEESMRSMTRPERRAYRAKLYAQKIDSLVQSRDYMFFPNSMQEVPGGMIRSIYTDYYFFGMFIDHVGVHLPTERGITQYLYVLNFDSPSLSGYRAERLAHLLRFCRRRYALPCRLRGFDRHRRDGADADGSRPCHALCRVALGQTDRRSQVPATGLSGGFH